MRGDARRRQMLQNRVMRWAAIVARNRSEMKIFTKLPVLVMMAALTSTQRIDLDVSVLASYLGELMNDTLGVSKVQVKKLKFCFFVSKSVFFSVKKYRAGKVFYNGCCWYPRLWLTDLQLHRRSSFLFHDHSFYNAISAAIPGFVSKTYILF